MQQFKSLRAAVMICATLVNTHTHTTQTHTQLSTCYVISSDSWTKQRPGPAEAYVRPNSSTSVVVKFHVHVVESDGFRKYVKC